MVVRATRSRRPKRGLAVAVLVVIAVAAVLGSLRFTAEERFERWSVSCQARGAIVEEIEPEQPNPLLVQSGDAAFRCRGADGRTLSTWR